MNVTEAAEFDDLGVGCGVDPGLCVTMGEVVTAIVKAKVRTFGREEEQ